MALSLNDIQKKKRGTKGSKPKMGPHLEKDISGHPTSLKETLAENVKPWVAHKEALQNSQASPSKIKTNNKLNNSSHVRPHRQRSSESKTKTSQEPSSIPYPLSNYLQSLQKLAERIPDSGPFGRWARAVQLYPKVKIPLPEFLIQDDRDIRDS